jgi:hypothetical protein
MDIQRERTYAKTMMNYMVANKIDEGKIPGLASVVSQKNNGEGGRNGGVIKPAPIHE